MKRIIVIFLAITFFWAGYADAATLTETQVGGENTGAISVSIGKHYDTFTLSWKRTIVITYETRDASGNVIRTGAASLDYDTMTAGEKNYVDGIINKAINKAKTSAGIP